MSGQQAGRGDELPAFLIKEECPSHIYSAMVRSPCTFNPVVTPVQKVILEAPAVISPGTAEVISRLEIPFYTYRRQI